ncbi:GMC family oxidoreductase [Streptomyces sp. AC555_RSS877]|uniref:GMC family oxidoreductase n=1 Tax=Streptomyces sp. AC555_RSS877 TaxID=2823688 RepID=UPI0027E49D4F|nr:GMC family oxidoreductase [Streptomyces sp. AC555_RSS877]
MPQDTYDYDVIVVGSGFGGSVTALRLTEKGYRVGVLEAGRRFTRATLPRNSWDLKNYFWAPKLGMYGIQRIHLLGNVMVLAGARVGGGSLNYANTHYVPPKPFFEDAQWRDITDWEEELKPYYDQAQRMLGVRLNPTMTPSDVHLKAAAERMGVGDTFHMAPVGVFFGDGQDADGAGKARPGEQVADPYFGGAGPARKACTECGECMTGCRHGAKNTLNENYLYLAEKAGAVVHPLTTVVSVTDDSQGGYAVATLLTDRKRSEGKVFKARQVVLAAGTYGTQTLLHRMKAGGQLPHISDRLGELTRTNSEALVGAQTDNRRYRKVTGEKRVDFTRGVAITSSIHPDENTHIEPVRYGKGSNSMGGLSILQVPYAEGASRVLAWLANWARHPLLVLRSLSNRRWSERTIIGLVMQSLDNSLTTYLKPDGVGKGLLTARQGHGAPNPKHRCPTREYQSPRVRSGYGTLARRLPAPGAPRDSRRGRGPGHAAVRRLDDSMEGQAADGLLWIEEGAVRSAGRHGSACIMEQGPEPWPTAWRSVTPSTWGLSVPGYRSKPWCRPSGMCDVPVACGWGSTRTFCHHKRARAANRILFERQRVIIWNANQAARQPSPRKCRIATCT